MQDMIDFSKNAALLGGALALMSIEEPWPASLPPQKPSATTRRRRIARQVIAA